jgi:hypothetical protein
MSKDQKEINRVLGNPSNLIVSDSLKDRLDFGITSSPEIAAKITVSGKEIAGRFLEYRKNINTVTVVFSCQEENLGTLLDAKLNSSCSVNILENKIDSSLLNLSFYSAEGELFVTVEVVENS